MLCFLGLRLERTIADRQKYKECLQEMRHYLSLRKADVQETEYLITVSNQSFIFALPKHPLYLHTSYFNMPLFNSQDYDFLETSYECLMILQEAFPVNLKIELVADDESQELEAFQSRKAEELSRRINNNLRTLAQSAGEITANDVESIIFLVDQHYTRKNKVVALKLLTNKVSSANVADLPEEFMEILSRMQEEADLRKLVGQLLGRIRSIQGEFQREKQNHMRGSNLTENKYCESVKLQPLIFQLKESYNLERLCALLAHALENEQDKEYYGKLESSINVATGKFLANEFEEEGRFGPEFYELLKRFWSKRGKKWDECIRTSLQGKIRSVNPNINRNNSNKSRVITSRMES